MRFSYSKGGRSQLGPRTQANRPLPYTSHLNSLGIFRSPAPLLRATIPLSLASFICSGSILAKPKVCILTFSNAGHSCVPTFPFLLRTSSMRESSLFSSCAACTADWYARLGALPTFYNVSCPVYLWTEHSYQLVPRRSVVSFEKREGFRRSPAASPPPERNFSEIGDFETEI